MAALRAAGGWLVPGRCAVAVGLLERRASPLLVKITCEKELHRLFDCARRGMTQGALFLSMLYLRRKAVFFVPLGEPTDRVSRVTSTLPRLPVHFHPGLVT